MTQSTIALSPHIAEAIAEAQAKVDEIDYGSVTLTFTVHDSRVAYIETTSTTKRKTTGHTGGNHDNTRR